jgi:hypothetical protein
MCLGSKARPARKAYILSAICKPAVLENVGISISHNPIGLHGLAVDSFTLPFYVK